MAAFCIHKILCLVGFLWRIANVRGPACLPSFLPPPQISFSLPKNSPADTTLRFGICGIRLVRPNSVYAGLWHLLLNLCLPSLCLCSARSARYANAFMLVIPQSSVLCLRFLESFFGITRFGRNQWAIRGMHKETRLLEGEKLTKKLRDERATLSNRYSSSYRIAYES